MAHSSRNTGQNAAANPDIALEKLLGEQQRANGVVASVIDHLVQKGAEILQMKYIRSQIVPYASRTVSKELFVNASWAFMPLDTSTVGAEFDDDLLIPPIDEWAGGVLPVRSITEQPLRASSPPPKEVRRMHTRVQKRPKVDDSSTVPSISSSPSTRSYAPVRSRGTAHSKDAKKRAPKPPVSEAVKIMRVFEEAKKKTVMPMKPITVDSDFTVIQITEPKSLPPALIVPKVNIKRPAVKATEYNGFSSRKAAPSTQAAEKVKKRGLPKLIENDAPTFDEEIAEVSYSDKVVCQPGVTFKDGSTIKSRPPTSNPAQLTRQQYEVYLEEMKNSAT